MSNANTEEVNASIKGDETHSLGSQEKEDVGNVAGSSSAPISSEEAARQIMSATDPLTRQLEKICILMKELRRDSIGVM